MGQKTLWILFKSSLRITWKFLLIGNIPSILHGTYHTQTKPYNIPCQKRLGNLCRGGNSRSLNGNQSPKCIKYLRLRICQTYIEYRLSINTDCSTLLPFSYFPVEPTVRAQCCPPWWSLLSKCKEPPTYLNAFDMYIYLHGKVFKSVRKSCFNPNKIKILM